MEDYEFHIKRIEQSRDELLIRRDQLIAEIQTVFKDIELGDGITLREAKIIDNYGTPDERARARRIDQDTHWSQVNIEDVDPGCSALSFTNAAGLRFYIPAYLVYTLKYGFNEVLGGPLIGSNTFEFIIYELNPSMHDSAEIRNHSRNKFADLNHSECVCIARFLALYAELDPNDDFDDTLDALKHDWGQYLSQAEYQHLQSIWPDHFN